MMNKWYIPLGVLLVLLPACRSDREKEAAEVVEEVPETRMTEPFFHAGFEGMEDASKVYMDGEYRILWDAGDEISIFTKTTQNRRYGFLGATGDGEGDFEAVTAADGSSPAQARNVAAYPYQASAACDTDGRLTLYLHGAKEGRKLDVLQQNDRVAFVLETNVSQVSGGDIPCKYGEAYASVMGEGRAVLLTDSAEKMAALSILMKTQTGRTFSFTPEMTDGVAVIRIDVDSFTAKARPMA